MSTIIIIESSGKKHKKKAFSEIIFSLNNLKFKTKGGFMTVEMRPSQAFEFDLVFKNKNANPAFVDGQVPFSFEDPNTSNPVTTTATVTSAPVDPDANGNSTRHHVKVQTSADDITAIQLAALKASPDVDIVNDHDDSTTDDVKTVKFSVLSVVFKPLEAVDIAVENATAVVDVQ